MPAIQRIAAPTFERGEGLDHRVRVRFKLNLQPDRTWIDSFKAHAASSVLAATNAVFRGSDVSIDVAKPNSMPELATALDCFIECANLRLRSWGGADRRPAAARRRFRDRV